MTHSPGFSPSHPYDATRGRDGREGRSRADPDQWRTRLGGVNPEPEADIANLRAAVYELQAAVVRLAEHIDDLEEKLGI
jgi:hypothetical protein